MDEIGIPNLALPEDGDYHLIMERISIGRAGHRRFLCLLLCLFMITGTMAPAADLPGLAPDPAIREMARSEELSFAELAELSLRVSGVDGADIHSSLRRLEQIHSRLQARLADEQDLYHKGKRLLTLLHQEMLSVYDENQSRMDVLLTEGRHNCVSSGVLYMIMATGLGLEVQGVIVPDHVFVSVMTPQGRVDVETTTEYGFDPGTVRNFTDAFREMTGFRYLPPGDYEKREITGKKRYLGLIYQNRIALLQRQDDHRAAAALAVDRYILDPKSREGLVGLLRNYINVLAGKKRYAKALTIIDQGIKRFGLREEMSDVASAITVNAVLSHIEEGSYDTASRLLADYAHLVQAAKVSDLNTLLLMKEMQADEDKELFTRFMEKVDRAVDSDRLTPEDAEELYVRLYAGEMNRLLRQGNLREPLFLLRAADEGLKENRKFQQLLETARKNGVVHYHNAAVSLMAETRFQEALEVVEEGLVHIPGSATLENDRRRLQEIIGLR